MISSTTIITRSLPSILMLGSMRMAVRRRGCIGRGSRPRRCVPPIEATFQPDVTYGGAGELQQGVTDMPYAIPNVRCENGAAANHVRIGWDSSVYNIPHAFAVWSFVDALR